MDNKAKVKRQHRDTIFRGHFKIPENFLHLHQHCTKNTSTLTVNDIKSFDLESAVTTRIRRNDVSFITTDNRLIILVEHQSTINPNMALRLYLYYVELLQLWIKLNNVNIYGHAKVEHIPTPEFYVVYNGTAPLEEDVSYFYIESEGMTIKATVNIINIHFDNLGSTQPDNALAGYAYFYKIYDSSRQANMPADDAFEKARQECITHGYLKGFIEREDFIMFYKDFLDYDKQQREDAKYAGMREGKIEGRIEGKIEGIEKAISLAIIGEAPISLIKALAKEANISAKRLDELMAQAVV